MAGVHGVPRRTARCCRRPGSTFLDRHSPTVGYTMLEELDFSENPRFLCSWTLRRAVISARCAVTSHFHRYSEDDADRQTLAHSHHQPLKIITWHPPEVQEKAKTAHNKQKLRTMEREHVKKKTNSMKFKWF